MIVDYFRCFNHYLKKDVFLHTVKVFFYKDPHKREKIIKTLMKIFDKEVGDDEVKCWRNFEKDVSFLK